MALTTECPPTVMSPETNLVADILGFSLVTGDVFSPGQPLVTCHFDLLSQCSFVITSPAGVMSARPTAVAP